MLPFSFATTAIGSLYCQNIHFTVKIHKKWECTTWINVNRCGRWQEPFDVLCLGGRKCRRDAGQKPQPNITHHPSEKETERVCLCRGHTRPQKLNYIIHTSIQNWHPDTSSTPTPSHTCAGIPRLKRPFSIHLQTHTQTMLTELKAKENERKTDRRSTHHSSSIDVEFTWTGKHMV